MKCDQAEKLIELHLSGEASSQRLDGLRQHAATCQQCGPAFVEADQTARLLRGSLLAVAAITPSPKPFIQSWVATSKLVSSPAPSKPISRRIAQPTSFARYCMATAMLLCPVMLLVTLGIIFKPVQGATKKNYAIATIANLQVAIMAYETDWGEYPPTGDDSLVRYLDGDPENGGPARTYFHFISSQISPDGEYFDPWGRPYHYRVAQTGMQSMNARTFDLWSQGHLSNDPEKYVTNWRDIPSPR